MRTGRPTTTNSWLRSRRESSNTVHLLIDIPKLSLNASRAAADSRGLHSGKEIAVPRIGNASEVKALNLASLVEL